MRFKSKALVNRVGTLSALAAILAWPAWAQGDVRPGGQQQVRQRAVAPFSAFYLTTGTLLMDVSKLNPRFERLDLLVDERPGFYTLSNDGYSIGVGGYGAVRNRLVAGAEFHSADLGQETSPTGKTNQMTTKYWMGTLGYAAFTSWRVNVIPFAGIGLGSMELSLKARNGGAALPGDQDPTFDEVIASPGALSTMSGSYVMVQPGVALDFLLVEGTKETLGVTLGIRFASALTPNRTTWKYEGREVFGGPDVGPVGGSVRVLVGIGGFRLGGAAAR